MTDGDDSPPSGHRDPSRVREVYDSIATHFSKTREYPWPEIESFVESVAPAARGLDIGCGNGRHMATLAEKVQRLVGVDTSRGLLLEARDRRSQENWHGELVQGDAGTLPCCPSTIDIAVYIATLHHLPTQEQRRGSLSELARVLDTDGVALVSAWSTTHDRFSTSGDADTGFDTTVDWTLPGGETVPRFYHIYAPAEFDSDLEAAGLDIQDSYISSGNCYATVTAPDSDKGKRP